MDFAVLADLRVKLKKSEPSKGIEKTVEHESVGYINCNWCSWYSYQRIGRGTGGHRNKRTSGDHQNYSIVVIG